jgi:hypothetical protein
MRKRKYRVPRCDGIDELRHVAFLLFGRRWGECGENMEVWKKRRKEMENLGFMGEMSLAQGERIK